MTHPMDLDSDKLQRICGVALNGLPRSIFPNVPFSGHLIHQVQRIPSQSSHSFAAVAGSEHRSVALHCRNHSVYHQILISGFQKEHAFKDQNRSKCKPRRQILQDGCQHRRHNYTDCSHHVTPIAACTAKCLSTVAFKGEQAPSHKELLKLVHACA